MVWRPNKRLGLVVGVIILLTICAISLLLLGQLVGSLTSQARPDQGPNVSLLVTGLFFFLSLFLIGLWVYWYCDLVALRYHLDRNALTVQGATGRHIVPMAAIEHVVPGAEIRAAQGFKGVGWPGYMKGRLRTDELGELIIMSTEPMARQVVIVTRTQCYGISPEEMDDFVTDLAARRALGPMRDVRQRFERAALVALPVWHDRVLSATLLLGCVVNVGLYAFILSRYGLLPQQIMFEQAVGADRIVSKEWLLIIPTIGATSLAADALLGGVLHRWEKLAAHLLATAALTVQSILWVAAIRILP